MRGAVFPCLLLCACSSGVPDLDSPEYQIGEAKKEVSSKLKDPSSAQFSDVYVSETGAVCGKVNGKNAFGAYAGATSFVYIPITSSRARIEKGEFGAFLDGEEASYLSPDGSETTPFSMLYSEHCLGMSRDRLIRERDDFMNAYGN